MISSSAPGSFSIVSRTWIFCNTLHDDGVGNDDELAIEVIENLEAGMGSFREVLRGLIGK